MKIIQFVMFSSILLFIGCAAQYSTGDLKKEFTEIQLSDNLYKVSYIGGSDFGEEKVIDLTLFRSAEVAQQNGFQYFAVIVNNNFSDTSVAAGQSTSSVSAMSYASANPARINTILCFKGKPIGASYDVNVIIPSLRKKYNISG
jgi:hypothetical protein